MDSALGERIAKLRFFVINAKYALAAPPTTAYPTVSPPAAVYTLGPDDINELVTFVKTAILPYGGDISKITIAGGSAGGHLALLQATRLDNTTEFQCVISASGPTDLVSIFQNQNYPVSSYLVGSTFVNILESLVKYSPVKQISNLKTKKLLLAHQNQDNLVPIDQALRLAAKTVTMKPSVNLTKFFLNDINSLPLLNPTPTRLTHLATEDYVNGMLAYINQDCR